VGNRVRYGYFPWWPEDGDDWVHPEDVGVARRLIPSPRVFRRIESANDWSVLEYGPWRVRVRPTLWEEIAWEGYCLGDWVEVLSQGGQQTFRTGTIREMLWDTRRRGLVYQIEQAGTPIPNRYAASDLRPVELPDERRRGELHRPEELSDESEIA